MTRRTPAMAGLLLSVALAGAACSSPSESDASPPAGTPAPQSSAPASAPASAAPIGSDQIPDVTVTPLATGLDRPWDVVQAPDGTTLFDERAGRFSVVRPGGTAQPVTADLSDLFVGSETGLMGLALSPTFDTDRTLYSCQGMKSADSPTIGVVAWTVADDWASLTRERTVISGFPVTSGRHGGCRILARPDGTLFVGTGDSAQGTVPQDPTSLGGKVLHIDAATGAPAAGNPDPNSPIFTLGHRNVQGLAARPGTDQIFNVEQGSSRDDEVNLLVAGGNYGWRPDRSGGYDESVAMTDPERVPGTDQIFNVEQGSSRDDEVNLLVAGGNYGWRPDRSGGYDESVAMTDPERVPGALDAVWSSGPSTVATASGTFLQGEAWGAWDGMLAIGVQKDMKVILLGISEDGTTSTSETTIPALSEYGRIRTVSAQPNGTLLVTTDNSDNDQVLVVAPK